MSLFDIRPMTLNDAEEVAALQSFAFPPPFPPELLWQVEHLRRHVELFPDGQFVAVSRIGHIVGSASSTLISEERWHAHGNWDETVGGPFLDTFEADGTTMYGLDVTVHPEYRRLGIGRSFYGARYLLTRNLGLQRYGTACRLPDYSAYLQEHPGADPLAFAQAVLAGRVTDRTMTPLLRYGLTFLGVIENYMEDMESGNAAALLEAKR